MLFGFFWHGTEPSDKGFADFDFLKDDCSTPALAVPHYSEDFQHDSTNEDVQSIDEEEEWMTGNI